MRTYYAIATIATLLNTIIKVFTTFNTTPILHTLTPYPGYTAPPFLPELPPQYPFGAHKTTSNYYFPIISIYRPS